MKKNSNIGKLLIANKENIFYIFLLNLILLIPAAMSPIFKRVFVDSVLGKSLTEWLPPLIVLMLLISLVAAILSWLQRNSLLRLSNKIEISGAANYMWKLFHAPMSLFDQKDRYVLLSQADASKRISKTLTRDVINLIFALVNVVFYVIMMLKIDVTMTAAVLLLIILNYVGIKLKDFLAEKFAGEDTKNTPRASDLALKEDMISASGLIHIETFKSTASESVFFQRLIGFKQSAISARKNSDYQNAYLPLDSLPEIVFLNLLLLICALRIMDKSFTIGNYLVFEAYASLLFLPLNEVFGMKNLFTKAEKTLKGLYKTIASAGESPVGDELPENTGKLNGYIEFDQVSFGYDLNNLVLEDFSLSVQPGQRVAIIGNSGAGKSTILKLLQGLYSPTYGTITIDGIAPDKIDRTLYVNSIGSANQNIDFFSVSVRDNITMWDGEVSDADVYRAANDAHIHEYIASLAGAYDYELAENGKNLSGGQRQKLEIARALLYNPAVVIFDEATSAVDLDTNMLIEQMLKTRGYTCVVATHLLSYISDYDEIIVLDKGKVQSRGKHESLMATCPYYQRAWAAESVGQV
jgi:ABC-type bacteriocin/lantibiotic exporter with double-glycine peptidase domain